MSAHNAPSDNLSEPTQHAESVALEPTKDAVLAALVMNGWSRVFEEWWKTYNPHRSLDQLEVDRAVNAYLALLTRDVAEALVNGHYADGVCPNPSVPPARTDGDVSAE